MQPGETLIFYEVNPAVERLAKQYFTYLEDSTASVDVRIGDARLLLETEETASYNAIFVDAFSGDGIPTHLMTVEAVDLYMERLAPGGVLVFHVSNRYYDLRGVLGSIAEELELAAMYRFEPAFLAESDDPLYQASTAVVLARDSEVFGPLPPQWKSLDRVEKLPAWTDERTDILAALRAMARLAASKP
jgi:spermidine synthase